MAFFADDNVNYNSMCNELINNYTTHIYKQVAREADMMECRHARLDAETQEAFTDADYDLEIAKNEWHEEIGVVKYLEDTMKIFGLRVYKSKLENLAWDIREEIDCNSQALIVFRHKVLSNKYSYYYYY